MALNDMGGYSMTMPVAPLYGGGYPLGGYGCGLNGFGGDGWWIILLLLLGGGLYFVVNGFGIENRKPPFDQFIDSLRLAPAAVFKTVVVDVFTHLVGHGDHKPRLVSRHGATSFLLIIIHKW